MGFRLSVCYDCKVLVVPKAPETIRAATLETIIMIVFVVVVDAGV